MPIFDFVCTKCEVKEERFVNRSEIENQKCRKCPDEPPMIQSEEISRTNFSLKGVWYKTHRRY